MLWDPRTWNILVSTPKLKPKFSAPSLPRSPSGLFEIPYTWSNCSPAQMPNSFVAHQLWNSLVCNIIVSYDKQVWECVNGIYPLLVSIHVQCFFFSTHFVNVLTRKFGNFCFSNVIWSFMANFWWEKLPNSRYHKIGEKYHVHIMSYYDLSCQQRLPG